MPVDMAACSRRLASEPKTDCGSATSTYTEETTNICKLFVGIHVGKLPFEGMDRLLEMYQRIWNEGVD